MRFSTILLLLLIPAVSARAQVSTDAPILTMMYQEQTMFHSMMQLNIVQQLAQLKQTYDESMRYFNEFKQLNSGSGLFNNIAAEFKTAQKQEDAQIMQQLNQTFVNTHNTNTPVDKFFQSLNQGIENNANYVSSEFSNLLANKQNGQNIANNANGLAPKDAANLSAKAQGIQIQELTQLHEDNLRLIQLLSMQLSAEARRQGGDASSIQAIQTSLQDRYQNAAPQGDSAQ